MDQELTIDIRVDYHFQSNFELAYFLVDLNSLCNFADYLYSKPQVDGVIDLLLNRPYRGVTTRRFNRKSKDRIHLINFSQGSLLETIVAPVIVGIILKIFEKSVEFSDNSPKVIVNIYNNTTLVNIINEEYDVNKTIESNIESINKRLIKDGIIKESSISYDAEGRKVLVDSINRMRGAIFDEKW